MIPKGADKITYLYVARRSLDKRFDKYSQQTILNIEDKKAVEDCLDELELRLKQDQADEAKRKAFRAMKEESKLCNSCGRRFLNAGNVCSTCRDK